MIDEPSKRLLTVSKQKAGRIAAIDYGLKRIGMAISDDQKKIALPLQTVPGGNGAIAAIQKVLAEKLPHIEKILIGLPLLLNGQEAAMASLVKQFANQLHSVLSIPIALIDERLTSKLADRSLQEIQLSRKKRTDRIDAAAATMLLQSYLDGLS